MKSLTDYLESIGKEIHDRGFADAEGNIRVITKDEQLAREVWARALGYEKETVNSDGTMIHRVVPPDYRAQEFIWERREGKSAPMIEEKRDASLVEKISEITKSQVNEVAEQAIDDRDDI